MRTSTKVLKQIGANAGFPKNAISILHDKKFVGKYRTNKGTLVNLYEFHDTTAHVMFHKIDKKYENDELIEMIRKIADQGCEVCFYRHSMNNRISGVFYKTIYTEDGSGKIRDIDEEMSQLKTLQSEADERIKALDAKYGIED